MRQAAFALWSNQSSFVHRLDARVKLLLMLAFIVSLALLRSPSPVQLAACLIAAIGVALMAKLPVIRLLAASLLVFPFVGLFSLIVYLSGDRQRAFLILIKSYLSALSVLVTVSSTPLPQLLWAARFFRVPKLLIEVMQLIYRYIFVLSAQVQAMRTAFMARGGGAGRLAFQAASGMVGVLFSRSYEKAAAVERAMLARSFSGRFGASNSSAITLREAAILGGGLALTVALHFI